MVKAPSCEKVGLKRGKWTDKEDELLVKYIQANGEGSWRSLPKNAGLLRCGKSCRLRWTNYLRSNLKRGKFTAEEDETIVKLHSTLGNRWSSIAQLLSGRTDNEIKNYWNSNLRRRIYTFRNLKELIKTTANIPKIVVDGDCGESSIKRDITIGLEGSSTESLLSEDNIVVDRGSTRKNDSSCLGSNDGAMWSEVGLIESLLSEDIEINSSCLRGMSNATWFEESSIESPLLEKYVVDIGSNQETNSSCLEGKDDMWSEEGGSFKSLLLENIETNSSCPKWYEGGSIESFLLKNYIVDIVSNRETSSSYFECRDKVMWSEEGSSIESLFMRENYIDDLEFLTQSLPDEIKGLAMQQHEHHAKPEIHEPRSEEEDDNKNKKDIHVVPKQQVCNGIWTFEEQGQQIQGPHEQNEIVLLQQHDECLHKFDNNWSDINLDYFFEEEYGV